MHSSHKLPTTSDVHYSSSTANCHLMAELAGYSPAIKHLTTLADGILLQHLYGVATTMPLNNIYVYIQNVENQ